MKRIEFLKQSLTWKCYRKTAWMISVFSVIREPEDAWKKDPYVGRIVSHPWGYSFVNENSELVKIEDAKTGVPIFSMLEEISIDPTWIINLDKPLLTLIGSLFVNQILLVENFGPKVPFVAEDVDIRKIESIVISKRAEAVPGQAKDPGKIYLDEYLGMATSIEFLKTISNLSVYSLTERNILPPAGIEKFKADLIKEYEGRLDDPVNLAEFEKKLIAFDTEYLKGDPSDGKLISGKIRVNGRRKLFLSSGAEGGLQGAMVPVTESLLEGVPLNPKNFTALVNGARAGSYFRGVDTVKGGVSAKILIRVMASFEVKEGDCGSTKGITRIYTKYNIGNLVTRRFAGVSGSKPIENLNEANNYLGKVVKLRSPMYCKYPGQTFCEICAGERLSRFKKGLSIPATDMSGAILAASMAAMHKNTLSVATLDLETALS